MVERAGEQTGCVTYAFSNTKLLLDIPFSAGVSIQSLPYAPIVSVLCWSEQINKRFGLVGIGGYHHFGVLASNSGAKFPLEPRGYINTRPVNTPHRFFSVESAAKAKRGVWGGLAPTPRFVLFTVTTK